MKILRLAIAALLCWQSPTQATPTLPDYLEDGVLYTFNNINVLSVNGSHQEMGYKYGRAMKNKLHCALDIILDYYQVQNKIPYANILATAEQFTNRYSYGYELFLQGVSSGSGLSLGNCQILNAMETLGSLLDGQTNLSWCAFMALPPKNHTPTQHSLAATTTFPPPTI